MQCLLCPSCPLMFYEVNKWTGSLLLGHDNTNSSPSAPAHFSSETTFRPGLPWSSSGRPDEDQGNPGRNVVSDKKCAGAEGEELVFYEVDLLNVRIVYGCLLYSVFLLAWLLHLLEWVWLIFYFILVCISALLSLSQVAIVSLHSFFNHLAILVIAFDTSKAARKCPARLLWQSLLNHGKYFHFFDAGEWTISSDNDAWAKMIKYDQKFFVCCSKFKDRVHLPWEKPCY